MLSSDGGEKDLFFDSAEYLSSEESVVVKEELEYEIWLNEPPSVKERRESFLRQMGLAESGSTKFGSVEMERDVGTSSEMMGLERLLEWSGAASSSCSSSSSHIEEYSGFHSREGDNLANFMYDELDRDLQDKSNLVSILQSVQVSTSGSDCSQGGTCSERETEATEEECESSKEGRKKKRSWWKQFINKSKRRGGKVVSEVSKPDTEVSKENRMKIKQNSKRYMEFAALCTGQEIQAHNGFIWTMKFSPDGQYIATGGEDGVVRIWCVTADASCNYLMAQGNLDSKLKKIKSGCRVIFPDNSFRIEESPLQEFLGHSSDVLDLAWSNSNRLISSSMDKTVRLWEVGCSQCLHVFHHNDYVTCIQFNPLDDNYFISGSIDGKVRVWGLSEKRVVDWADVRDVITAICYQPDGKGFAVGSLAGTCRFYEESGKEALQLVAQIHIRSRRKISGNKITGIQFSEENAQRVMITSEDSKVRVFDGVDLIKKYRGLPKSGSQMSASFTSSGKRIISVGEDSRVYLWDYDSCCVPSSKHTKSVRSCEHFYCEGVSVAIPWSGMGTEDRNLETASPRYCSQTQDRIDATPGSRDSERFLLGNWFFLEGSCRGSATWPEENLPQWDSPVAGEEDDHWQYKDHQHHHHHNKAHNHLTKSETWGLVIVTAGWDGKIRTFHNYGLPVSL
ncbi:uncharacterized protein LOC133724534 [Rosa rugosa]|uniref:uncharacterized protein LOC133724534 n=1 Tax=Rosa rugosa TaxID=74645 RepID=UPI002B40D030|nr:uncharacterized protein LOC133724534 [Rosa rugosa]XP_062007274.1 uncharacterized protein LOC133724534 [Rosa rugosa]